MKVLRKINNTLWIYEDIAGTFVGWATWHKDFCDTLRWREKEVEEYLEFMEHGTARCGRPTVTRDVQTGSNPVCSAKKMTMGYRLKVGRWTLNPVMVVRIHLPQPYAGEVLMGTHQASTLK